MATHDRIRSRVRHHQDRKIEEVVHDAYKERYRPQEPAVCPDCGVVYEHGSFHWKPRPSGAHEHRCPACRRIADRYPAGYLTLEGPFLAQHREEVLHLVRNEESRARSEHPMERIMDIAEEDGKTVITTTELHLPQRIGEALHKAYQGELQTQYAPDEYRVRVHWKR